MLEVLRSASCGVNSSIDEKMKAIDELEGKYSVRVLCEALNLPRGTYYNRKRRENTITSYEINDAEIKPLIEKIFMDSKRDSEESRFAISYRKSAIRSVKNESVA